MAVKYLRTTGGRLRTSGGYLVVDEEISSLPAPGNFEAAGGDSQVDLSWDSVQYATDYEIERDGTIIATITGTSYQDTGVSNGNSYDYRVRAINTNDGVNGDWAGPETATTASGLDAPSNFNVDAGDGRCYLDWDAVSGAEEYEIQRDRTEIAASPTEKTQHNDSNVNNGTTYSYRVRSVDSNGNTSAWTSEIDATPSAPSYVGPIFDFDDQTMQGMTVNDDAYLVFKEYTRSGQGYCAFTQTGSGLGVVAYKDTGGMEITSLSFYYREPTESNGGGIRLADANGNLIAGFATDNPEWHLSSSSGDEFVDHPNAHDEWMEVQATLDWSAGTVEATFTRLSTGYSATASRGFDTSAPVQEVQWCNYSGGVWYPDSSGNRIGMAIDDLDYS